MRRIVGTQHGGSRLLRMLALRVNDGALLGLIRKWLRAGILEEDGRIERPESGTAQGGSVSPVLANVYLSGTIGAVNGGATHGKRSIGCSSASRCHRREWWKGHGGPNCLAGQGAHRTGQIGQPVRCGLPTGTCVSESSGRARCRTPPAGICEGDAGQSASLPRFPGPLL
jgi:hypothetical protein